jgi:hypothetical protein
MRSISHSFRFIRLWLSIAILLQGAALIFHPAKCVAAPGGSLVAAISDEFDTLKPMWVPGLRGMPEFLTIHDGVLSMRSVDNGDDSYPSAEDMLCTYADQIGRSLNASERPSIVAQVWFPPFDQWPTGTNASGFREWLGLRVTAYDADLPYNNGLYWPGIYVATDDAGPCFIARVGDGYAPDVTIGRIPTAGWWTLGIAWNKDGRLECYAAPGRVTLTRNDLLHTTPTQPLAEANRSLDQVVGTFLALRMTDPPTGQLSPDWRLDSVRVYVEPPARRDFDGDGRADLLFQNTAGQIGRWYMNGSGAINSAAVMDSGDLGDWKAVGIADMNNDGIADIIFQDTAGQIAVWYLNGSGAISSAAVIYSGDLGDWKVVGVADMNKDGNADILFQNTAGQIAVWYLNGSGAISSGGLLYTGDPGDWKVVAIADMDNDGKADILFQNTAGQIAVWHMDGSGGISSSVVIYSGDLGDWKVVASADMNNDGNADILFQNTAGQIAVWYMNGSGGISSTAYIYSGGLGDWRVR